MPLRPEVSLLIPLCAHAMPAPNTRTCLTKRNRGFNKNGCPSFFFKRWKEWPLISTRHRRGFHCGSYKGRQGRGSSWKYSGRTLLCREIDWTSARVLREAIPLSRPSVLLCLSQSRSAFFARPDESA